MDIFHNPTTTVPRKDSRIVRVDFETNAIGARKVNMPKSVKNEYSITHVGNKG